MKNKEIRELPEDGLTHKLGDLNREMNAELGGKSTSGGRVQNPGKIRTLRRLIARVKTIMGEKERAALKKNKMTKPTQVKAKLTEVKNEIKTK